MSVAIDPEAPSPEVVPRAVPGVRPVAHRFFASSLALTILLVALAMAVGPAPFITTDEHALLAQAKAVASGSWLVDHPLPELDMGGRTYPDELAGRTSDGRYAPYYKRPAVPTVLALAHDLIGPLGPRLVVVAGQVAAALAVARLVRRIAPDLAIVSFWLTGLFSPLAFHNHVLWMHSWALALSAAATEALLVLDRGASGRRAVASGAALTASVVAMVLVRTEGLLFGAAVAAALAGSGLTRRRPRLAVAAGAVAVVAWGVRLLEGLWVASVAGELEPARFARPSGLVFQRVAAITNTFLMGGDTAASSLLATAALGALVAAGLIARRSDGRGLVIVVGSAGVVLHAAALFWPTPNLLPGMVPALPILFVPLLLGGGGKEGRALGTLAVVMLGLVALSAYPKGAGLDWGGRYALAAVPALAALAADRLRLPSGPDVPGRRALALVLLAVTAVSGPAVLRRVVVDHERVTELERALERRLEEAAVEPASGRPVVLALDSRLGRLLSVHPHAVAALRASPDQLEPLLEGLRTEGIAEVLVLDFGDLDLGSAPQRAGWRVGPGEDLGGSLVATVLSRQGA